MAVDMEKILTLLVSIVVNTENTFNLEHSLYSWVFPFRLTTLGESR